MHNKSEAWNVKERNKSLIFLIDFNNNIKMISTIHRLFEKIRYISRLYLFPYFEIVRRYEATMDRSNSHEPVCLAARNNLQSVLSRVFCHAGLSR